MSSISTNNRLPPLREIPAEAAPWHLLEIEETALRLEVVPERGLEEAEAFARLEGFSVQPMVYRPGAYELIVGVTEDAQFGPVILFGQGGTAVEVVNDKALELPPLNMHLARELMSGGSALANLRYPGIQVS